MSTDGVVNASHPVALQTQNETQLTADALRPPLKWAGGKRWQVPHLLPLWQGNSHRRLVEPFCGGLAITFGLRPRRALLNDVNEHLASFFRWLKRGLVTEVPMRNDERLYYAHRARFNGLLRDGNHESAEAAALFYYLNRTGYNGLCCFNAAGEFNVPFGRYKSITYVRDFSDYRPPLRSWQFRCGDFAAVDVAPDDFVYADPPYDVEFTHYSKGGFSWDDQVRAAEWLAAHPGPRRIRRRTGSWRCTSASASTCASSRRPG